MVQVNNFLNIGKFFKGGNVQKSAEIQQKEVSLLEKDDGFDTVSFSKNTSEKFEDVYNEFNVNVPDITSTIDEKRLHYPI